MTSRRPRRTRIYDANYRLGENSYRGALDNLDRKYSSPLNAFRESSLPKPRINFGDDADLSLLDARQRASRAITEETVFDSRGFKIPKIGVPITEQVESQFDAEIQNTLDKLNARRKKLVEEEDFKPSFKNRSLEAELDDRFFGAKNVSESSNFVKRRALKVVASTENAIDQRDLSKWTKIDSTLNTASDSLEISKKRALETKARLREIEDDMVTRQEKQLARERRAANLRRIVNEDFESGLEAGIKAITF